MCQLLVFKKNNGLYADVYVLLLTVLAENPSLLENCPGCEHTIWVTSGTWIQSVVRAKEVLSGGPQDI